MLVPAATALDSQGVRFLPRLVARREPPRFKYGTTDHEGIGIVTPATGVATEVDGSAGGSSGPVWSPDGRWLVVTRDVNGGTVVLLDPDGVLPLAAFLAALAGALLVLGRRRTTAADR